MKIAIFVIWFNFTPISVAWDLARDWMFEQIHGKPNVEQPKEIYVDGKLVIKAN